MTNPFDPNNPFGYLDEVPEYDDLTPEERTELHVKGCLYGRVTWLVIGLIAMASILFSSCSTKEIVVTVDHYKTDTLHETTIQRDSIYMSDSIYIADFMNGDTVWRIIDRWHTRYTERIKTDTVYQSKIDTMVQAVENVREVAKPLTWWQQTRLYVANLVIVFAVVYAVVSFLRRRR